MTRKRKKGGGGAAGRGSDDLREKLMREIVATWNERKLPETQQKRFLPAVLEDVLRAIAERKIQRWDRIRRIAKLTAIEYAKAQLMQDVDAAIAHYRMTRNGGDPDGMASSTDDALQAAQAAVERLVMFAIGGRVKAVLEEPLRREALAAAAYLLATDASAVPSGSPSAQVWLKALTLAAEQEKTCVALWWEVWKLSPDGSSRAHMELMKVLYQIAIEVTPGRSTRVSGRYDIIHNVWCALRRLTDKPLDSIVDMDAFIRTMARKRGKSVIRQNMVDRNTDHDADVNNIDTGITNVAEIVELVEMIERFEAIIEDPSWNVDKRYRKLLGRRYVERMDEKDVVDVTVRELLECPDIDKGPLACRKLVRTQLARAKTKLRSEYRRRFKEKGTI